ncbi:MAG: protein kinase, partial [Planctomycetota bacterium]|nr:protein kinase [Planctomycetota bacterium]
MNKELPAGSTLSHYRIVSKIGAGGMGEVYRAHDSRLNRDVAVKLLPADLANDKDRLQRFEQEAKATSALNHPNILTVYDIGEHEGTPFIVAELLEGEELRGRLQEGPLPPRKATDYAQQIVRGLSAAHEKGIVHRDLKPENLFITKDDRVKILDFGLAKLRGPKPAAGSSEDETRKVLTNPGAVMGTAAYMSPEQVRGHAIDHRSDVFSFGLILHEMIAGRRTFQRETMAETMSAILKEEPEELTESNSNINPSLERIVRRCLEKKPERRFQSTADLGFALEALSTTSSSGANRTGAAQALETLATSTFSGWRDRSWKIAFGVALLGLIALAIPVVRHLRETPTPAPLRRFVLAVPSQAAPNWNDFGVAISPDGAQIAYNCREGNTVSLCARAFDSLTARRVADGREAQDWFFSPDGEWLGIADEVGLSKVSIRGGEPQMIHRWLDTEPVPKGFSWGPDDYILFGTKSGIQRVAASGGSTEAVTGIAPGSGSAAHFWPSHIPDDRRALIT